MPIPALMLNDNIKAYAEYSEYLAKSKGSAPIKTTGREVAQSKEVAEDVDSKETDKEPPVKRRPTGVVIGEEVRRESDEERIDHSKKLKGLETLSEAVQLHSGEGSGVTLEVPDELTLKSSNEGAGVTLEVPDEPSDHSSSSSSDLEFVVEDISSDDVDITKNADEAKKAKAEKDTDEHVIEKHVAKKQAGEEEQGDVQGGDGQAGDAQANVHKSEPLIENLEATLIKMTLTNVLRDPVEPEVQSMVDVPITQVKPAEQRPPLVDTTVTLILDSTTLDNRVTRLEKKVHAMSSFNLPDAIDKSVKSHLKNVLLKDVPDFGKIKIEKGKKSMPKHSSTPFNQAALDEFEEKDKLFQMMSKSRSYNRHLTHKSLYNAIALSLSVDEDDMEKELKQQPSRKKRCHDDQDQDPSAYTSKEKKKKRMQKESESSKKDQNHTTSSKKGTTPSKTSKPDKSVQTEEIVKEMDQEETMNNEEPVVNEVVNTEEHPQDNASLSQDSKDPNTDIGPEQNWFHNLEKTTKDPDAFEDLMNSTINFSNFIKHRLKKDKITKADLEGPVFKLLKGIEMVHDNLHDMLHNLKLGYNDVMPKRKWLVKDQEWTAEMLKLIDDLFMKRWIMWSLKCYVCGRLNEIDYRLRMQTI
ncbi:hypothetical protein Tco_0694480 [Tanacetum coccineum]